MAETSAPPPLIETGFFVSGEDFDPHSCTPAFGVTPTAVSIRGQSRLGRRPPVATSSWCLKVERQCYSIDDGLRDLLNQIWPHRDAIKRFLETHSPKITFTSHVKIFSERPLYCLSPATLERMAHFNAEFCLDIFDVSE